MPGKSPSARVTFSTLPANENEASSSSEGCGMGSCRPPLLQRLANPKVYVFFYCMLGVLQGAYFTYTIGIISTIEKRYAFDSKISGIILIADNLSPIFTSLLIGYYGGQAHRPRLIGGGMMVVVISCFLSAFPYFLFGPGLHMLDKPIPESQISWTNGSKYETCGSGKDFNCEEGQSSKATVPAVAILFIANFLNGFGSAAFYTAGVSYLDDNVKKKDSPMYFGTTMAVRLFGPSLGFLLSSFCLKFYEDPTMKPNLSRTDPRWVGAWWLGFLLIGILLFVFTIPIFFFPKKLRKAQPDDEVKEDTPMPKIKDMPRALLKLSKNKIFTFHTIGVIFHINGLMGYFLLMPRYMEHHFRKSASGASLISGSTGIVTMLLGIVLGGIVIRRYRPRARFLTGYMVFVNSISTVIMLVVMFISCPPPALDAPIAANGQAVLINNCNAGCDCSTRVFQPVCGVDDRSLYFSPCHAGCRGTFLNDTTNATTMTSCECTSEPETAVDLTLGYCPFNCNVFLTYIVILSIAKLVSSTSRVGNTIVTLRCVDPKDKTLALGAIGCMFSIFAFIPYPLVFGAIADSTCLVWEASCGRRGNCWLYDVDKFRLVIHGACFSFMVVGTFFDLLVWASSGRLTDLYDDVPDKKVMLYNDEREQDLAGQWRKKQEEDEDHVLFVRGPMLSGSVNDVRANL